MGRSVSLCSASGATRCMALLVLATLFVIGSCEVALKRKPVVYMNQFAVHIPTGDEDASSIAAKHGFRNIGQIGALKGYYLFEHQRVHKRSTLHNDEHHGKLHQEPKVLWVQQQHEKRRVKRDFGDSFAAFGSDFSGLYDTGDTVQVSASHRPHYRGAPFPDPLYKEQWYLNGGAKDGYDMNIAHAWEKGYTGKGVVVSILDDGIQTNHPDLALNYDALASTDINDNDNDPMPRDNGDNKHGTRCAGEVAAVAFNQYCGIGVAYNASIGGVRMLDGTVNDAVEARALGLNPDHIDIYSASWGPEDDGKTVDGPGPLARRAFINGVTAGRKGKGSIFVWASGNGGRHTDSCNCDGYTNSIFTLSISSATQGGYKPWYLEECSSTLATTYSSGTPGHDKSIASADMDGKLRPDHICTVEHTGTSASAPLAAGMCALALEANPDLTWRDMQFIVILTSKAAPLEKENGWITNGIKRKVSHKFGYGLMDGEAMVSLAEQWSPVPPQHICKSQEVNEERPIDASFGSVLTATMDVNACINTLNEVRFLEHVQCKISLRFFPRGNLRMTLTSPMGTTSTLLFERPRDVVSSNFDDWPFLSVHFWGEKVEGRWTLQIYNAGNRHVNRPGILQKWQLIFYGTATNPIRLRPPPSQRLQQQQQQQQQSATNSFSFPSNNFYGQSDYFTSAAFRNLPNIFSVAGSQISSSITPLGGGRGKSEWQSGAHVNEVASAVRHDGTCDSECDPLQGCYGKGPSQCVACKHYRLDKTCVSQCPPRSFANQGNTCWPCHETCDTCAGPGQDACLTCAPAHLRVTDLAVCLQICPEGYYENTEQGTCVPCEANCASCLERPDHCTTCDHHLVLHENRCYAACPTYTYETDDYRCMPCHDTCETCSGDGVTQCVTCRSGLMYLDGTCHAVCPDGYYADKKRRECVPCPRGCATCNAAACRTCHAGYTLDNKSRCVKMGSARCPPSEYLTADGDTCETCHVSCDTCDGPDTCMTCASPLLLENATCVRECSRGFYAEQAQCVRCMHACTECVSRVNCTVCAPSLHLQSGQCRAACAQGYYSDVGTCSKCYLSCRTCSGPRRDQCVTCPQGWQLAAGECHPECPQGFFMSQYGCQKCHHYCHTCKGEGPLQCTSCPPRFMLDGGLCMECLGSQYYDPPTQLCKACDPTCKTCSGPGPQACVTCAAPLHPLNNQCVPCCRDPHVSHDCCHCDTTTGGCQNSVTAGKRRISVEQAERERIDELQAASLSSSSSYSSPLTLLLTTGNMIVALCICSVLIMAVVVGRLKMKSETPGGAYSKIPLRRQNCVEENVLADEQTKLCEREGESDEDTDVIYVQT